MRLLTLCSLVLLVGCATGELPVAETIQTGEQVRTPPQYEEFCERDEHDICYEVEE